MKRILHILPQFQPGGGMERVVMNYFNHIDSSKFCFDILTHKLENHIYADQIENSGGKVFVFPSFGLKTIAEIAHRFDELLSTRHYDVVHCHMANAAIVYLKIARKYDIPLRILHSHQDHYADVWSHAIRNIPLVAIGRRYANCNIACSKKAGEFLFKNVPFTILKNGIDVSDFSFSNVKRKNIREKLGITDEELVFGYIGRLVPQKNPIFILDVFFDCLKVSDRRMRLVIAGTGELELQMKNYAADLGIDEKIIWLGNVEYVSELDSGIDIFLMPSLYEGLGLSLVEAQSTGAECYASDSIPEEAFITDCVHPLPLCKGKKYWASQIMDNMNNSPKNRSLAWHEIVHNGFDISSNITNLENIYTHKDRGL
ncbi:glycosyltransferase [Bifidobacterium dentium]|uniref:glycosyltransferase n=1 Tax=Bifidobacterium dentium TaxID=1689 RepID=UPI001F50DDE0|nr:glycosyltransferase [Bifidobacterium dentium]